MPQSKCLVVYYSRTGNTRSVAEALAEALGAEVEEIVDKKERGGVVGFVGGGVDSMRKKEADIEEPQKNPADYELVLVGTPVWAWNMTPAVRAYLTRVRDRLPRVAFFLTTGGTGIEGTFEAMAALCGKEPAATLAFKERELKKDEWRERVREFVEKLGAS